jgi:hypothetical protein
MGGTAQHWRKITVPCGFHHDIRAVGQHDWRRGETPEVASEKRLGVSRDREKTDENK